MGNGRVIFWGPKKRWVDAKHSIPGSPVLGGDVQTASSLEGSVDGAARVGTESTAHCVGCGFGRYVQSELPAREVFSGPDLGRLRFRLGFGVSRGSENVALQIKRARCVIITVKPLNESR
jgi:hypothetical protein